MKLIFDKKYLKCHTYHGSKKSTRREHTIMLIRNDVLFLPVSNTSGFDSVYTEHCHALVRGGGQLNAQVISRRLVYLHQQRACRILDSLCNYMNTN